MATVAELAKKFIAWNAEHRKPDTMKFYKSRLKRFVEHFGEREFSSLNQLELEEYFTEVGRKLANSTRKHNIVAFTTLQNWALKRKQIEAPVCGPLEKPPAGQRNRIPTRKENAVILRAANRQFRIIYQALRHCGARPGELCSAQISDLKEDATVIVLEDHKTARKTGKPRRIPVGNKMRKWVRRGIGDRTEGPIFLSPRGKPWTTARLSQTFRRIRNKHGLKKDLVLYMTRHEFGTLATEKHGIHAASIMLGHTQITTTQRYAHADEDKLRKLQDDVL